MGTLQLEEATDGDELDDDLDEVGRPGNSWQGATVSISTVNVIRVRWVGTTGSYQATGATWQSTTWTS